MTADNPSGNPNLEQPLVAHLLELRDRLLRMVIAIFLLFLALFPFANQIYVHVAEPLMAQLPEGTSMIATEVASPFLTPFKLSLVAAVFLAMPYILFQFWAFVAPGLYKHEKRLVTPLLVSSIILFYLGILFAYYVVFPLVFAFFTHTAPEGVAVMTDISRYLDFVLTLFFAFGIAFEVPIAVILLVWMGVTTPESLGGKRPYIIVAAFVFGMLLTPPDVISQTLLALPVWLLFEGGVFFSRWFIREREQSVEEETPLAAAAGSAAGGSAADVEPDSPVAPAETVVGEEIAAGDPTDEERFTPMTEEEMEAELDAIEEEEEDELDSADEYDDADDEGPDDPVQAKLLEVQAFRDRGDEANARRLLYDILEEGNEDQRMVARNILASMDAS